MTADIHETEGSPRPRVFGNVDRAILEFERLSWSKPGRKESEVLTRFAMSMTAYYARLQWILTQPAAAAYDPKTFNRLTRIAGRRRDVRKRGTSAAGAATRADGGGIRPAFPMGGAQ